MPLCLRTVTNLLDRYDELLALSLADTERLRRVTAAAGRVILAIDGLQPDVGHEVLWVLRDCLCGEVLLARSLLSSTQDDLARLITEVKEALEVPIVGVVSDGQDSIRKAVKKALDGVPHQLCHFHYLREAAKPIYEADRHAKKELKKRVRGVRPIERKVEGRDDPEAKAIRGYCAAVRSALTDDGRPPLSAPGLVLKGRLEAVVESLDRVEEKGGSRRELTRLRSLLSGGLAATAALWEPVEAAYDWVFRAAAILANVAGLSGCGGEGELPGPAGCDGAARRAGRGPERGVGALPEGDAELLAGAVPLLRRGGPAADGQRPGAAVRVASVPRAAVERPEGGVAGAGGARVGAAAGGGGDAAAGGGAGRGPGAVGPGGLARAACRIGASSGGAGAGPAVPPRPGRVSPRT